MIKSLRSADHVKKAPPKLFLEETDAITTLESETLLINDITHISAVHVADESTLALKDTIARAPYDAVTNDPLLDTL